MDQSMRRYTPWVPRRPFSHGHAAVLFHVTLKQTKRLNGMEVGHAWEQQGQERAGKHDNLIMGYLV